MSLFNAIIVAFDDLRYDIDERRIIRPLVYNSSLESLNKKVCCSFITLIILTTDLKLKVYIGPGSQVPLTLSFEKKPLSSAATHFLPLCIHEVRVNSSKTTANETNPHTKWTSMFYYVFCPRLHLANRSVPPPPLIKPLCDGLHWIKTRARRIPIKTERRLPFGSRSRGILNLNIKIALCNFLN